MEPKEQAEEFGFHGTRFKKLSGKTSTIIGRWCPFTFCLHRPYSQNSYPL